MKTSITSVILVALVSFVLTPLISAEITPKDSKELNESTRVIMIKPGQTLADLALEYFGDRKKYKKFLEYNDIGNLNTIKTGDQLQVPVLANVVTPAKQTAPKEVNQPSSLAKVEAKSMGTPLTKAANTSGPASPYS